MKKTKINEKIDHAFSLGVALGESVGRESPDMIPKRKRGTELEFRFEIYKILKALKL